MNWLETILMLMTMGIFAVLMIAFLVGLVLELLPVDETGEDRE